MDNWIICCERRWSLEDDFLARMFNEKETPQRDDHYFSFYLNHTATEVRWSRNVDSLVARFTKEKLLIRLDHIYHHPQIDPPRRFIRIFADIHPHYRYL